MNNHPDMSDAAIEPAPDDRTLEVRLWRYTRNRVDAATLKSHLRSIVNQVRNHTKGWEFVKRRFADPVLKGDGQWIYRIDLRLRQTGDPDESTSLLGARVELALAIKNYQRFKANPYIWEQEPSKEDIEAYKAEQESLAEVAPEIASENKGKKGSVPVKLRLDPTEILHPSEVIIPPELLGPDGRDYIDQHPAFRGIYGRSAHIRRILRAVDSFRHSAAIAKEEPEKEIDLSRNHVLLWGPPAAAKSRIIRGLRRLLPHGAFDRLDAPSCTKAGIRELFRSQYRDKCPPIFFVEEIEKVPLEVLIAWLGILDERAEVSVTNFFKNDSVVVPFICIATCNDKGHLDKALQGALGSRFGHQIYVPRPNTSEMEHILLDCVREIRGDRAWVDVCLKFMDAFDTNDPRTVKAWLDYKDALTDGTAEVELREMHDREQDDKRRRRIRMNILNGPDEEDEAEGIEVSDMEIAHREASQVRASANGNSLEAFYATLKNPPRRRGRGR